MDRESDVAFSTKLAGKLLTIISLALVGMVVAGSGKPDGSPAPAPISISILEGPGLDFLPAHEAYLPAQGKSSLPVADARHPFIRSRTSVADPDACLDCHDDDSMTMERDGREISLNVSPEA